MLLTNRTDYALRALIYMARHIDQARLPLAQIAKDQKIPQPFLSKILQDLCEGGLVNSKVGLGGGFALCRPPEQISLLDVVLATERELTLYRCANDRKYCTLSDNCRVNAVFQHLTTTIADTLRSLSIAQCAEPGPFSRDEFPPRKNASPQS